MKICFLGDMHGCLFHALFLLALSQRKRSEKYDLIIQVGDLGIWADPAKADAATKRFAQKNPEQFDSQYLIYPQEEHVKFFQVVRSLLHVPIRFIKGNHEDFERLPRASPFAIDEFGLFEYVLDGRVLELGGFRIGFMGGSHNAKNPDGCLNLSAIAKFVELNRGKVDILVTHDAPYKASRGFTGQIQGCQEISQMVEELRPQVHVFGHLHKILALNAIADVHSYCVPCVVDPVREERDLERQAIKSGCLFILDTDNQKTEFVSDRWLSEIDRKTAVVEWTRILSEAPS